MHMRTEVQSTKTQAFVTTKPVALFKRNKRRPQWEDTKAHSNETHTRLASVTEPSRAPKAMSVALSVSCTRANSA